MDPTGSSPSSHPSPPAPPASAPLLSPARVIAALCILAPIVAILWIPSFNKTKPELLGFPFFYWYQLLWVVLTALLMFVAYFAVRRDESARRGQSGAQR